jgi:formylglycine-generating enzyme required for sulfatase activity/serine/threonine protein kinase
MSDSQRSISFEAEEAFADFLLSLERGEKEDFEQFCERHTDVREELRTLWNDWKLLSQLHERALPESSLVGAMLMRESSSESTAPVPDARARELFSEFLSQRQEGENADLEALCAQYPEHAKDLHALEEQWSRVEGLFKRFGEDSSLSPTLFLRHARESLVQGDSGAGMLVERLLRHGATAERYDRCGEVARGGMGAIHKVWDPHLRRNLAMKVIRGRDGGGDLRRGSDSVTPYHARFFEEAQVTGQLDHPGIVPVYELGIDENGRAYFTMRLVRGRDLKRIYDLVFEQREGWNQTRALGVLLRVCEAMAYAHSKRVIHRDLKPANVMVGRFGETYVMDWGLARVLDSEDSRDERVRSEDVTVASLVHTDRKEGTAAPAADQLYTMDGDVIGTPSYMAPEQVRGELEHIGPHSDVYSIGSMLYHLLTQRPPYQSADEQVSGKEVQKRLKEGPPEPLHKLNQAVPAELAAICDKAMSREIEERYADTTELADDLRAYLEDRVVRAYEAGPVAELKKWMVRNRAVGFTAAGVLAATLAGLSISSVSLANGKSQAVQQAQVAEEGEQLARDDLAEVNRLKAVVDKQNADLLAAEQQLKDSNETLTESNKALLETQGQLTRAHTDVLRLSDFDLVADVRARSALLWPASPMLEADLDRCLADVRDLESRRDLHAGVLETLRERGNLVERPDEATHWEFETPEARWHHDQQAALVEEIGHFGVAGGLRESLERRLEQAREIVRVTIEDHLATWDQAIASIRDRAACPLYSGLVIEKQPGLVPLGRNPSTGLWEFVGLRSGELPEVDGDGRVVLTDETGLVFVLVPPVKGALIGADTPNKLVDPKRYRGDPHVELDVNEEETPITKVDLDAFFLAKYEMNQAQWIRCTGRNPSLYRSGSKSTRTLSLMHPVEFVSWYDAAETLFRFGWILPTEAQWEYAARARSTTSWPYGASESELAGRANLADAYASNNGGPYHWAYETRLSDGFLVHAPVDRFEPNGFGLHNVTGNVAEWCLDAYSTNASAPRKPGTAERDVDGPERVCRGGSFQDTAAKARSAYRHPTVPGNASYWIGVRPARALDR